MTDRFENTLRDNITLREGRELGRGMEKEKEKERRGRGEMRVTDGCDDDDDDYDDKEYEERNGRESRHEDKRDGDHGDASSPYFTGQGNTNGHGKGKGKGKVKSKQGSGEEKRTDVDMEMDTDRDKSKEEIDTEKEKKPSRPRQTLLNFSSNGQLSTRKPLTNPTQRSDAARKPLKDIAEETKSLLPGLLATRPDVRDKGYNCKNDEVLILDKKFCPKLPSTQIKVINSDSIDAALALGRSSPVVKSRHPCVLNMANANSPGGGWMHGALAQEEALCYRTSLSRTLKRHYYPLPDKGGIYSPFVLVIRENLKAGHGLLDLTGPAKLPVISVVSVAAVCMPPTKTDGNGVQKYALSQDRRLMEEKMRVILRLAAKNGHRQIVLGAFGCGAFANPREEVAKMWAAVLKEAEFAGGWWADVVFAVLDDGRGNLRTFQNELDGLTV